MDLSSYLTLPTRSLPTVARAYANATGTWREIGSTGEWQRVALTARERLERNNRVVRLMTADAKRLCRA